MLRNLTDLDSKALDEHIELLSEFIYWSKGYLEGVGEEGRLGHRNLFGTRHIEILQNMCGTLWTEKERRNK